MRDLLGQTAPPKSLPLLFPSRSTLDQLEANLGISAEVLSQTDSKHYIPPPLAREFGYQGLVCSTLRYCRSCLGVGFHSPIHQLLLFERCVWHDEPLQAACPSCGDPLRFAIQDPVFRVPYGCRCGHRFWRPQGVDLHDSELRANAKRVLQRWVRWCSEIENRYCLFLFDCEFGFSPATHNVAGDIHASLSALTWLDCPYGWKKRLALAPPADERTLSSGGVARGGELRSKLESRAKAALKNWHQLAKRAHPGCLPKDILACGDRPMWRRYDGCAVSAALRYCGEYWNGVFSDAWRQKSRWESLVLDPVAVPLRKLGASERDIEIWVAHVSPVLIDEVVTGTLKQLIRGHSNRYAAGSALNASNISSTAASPYWQFSPMILDLEENRFYRWNITDRAALQHALQEPCLAAEGTTR